MSKNEHNTAAKPSSGRLMDIHTKTGLNPRQTERFSAYAPAKARGVGSYDPLAVSPLIELELRKNEHVGRYKTQRLVH